MKVIKGIAYLCSLLFHKLKNRLQGNKLTEKGKRLLEYLIKVINEDYKPQTMADYMYEKTFNPDNLEGEERQDKAASMFLILSQF